MRRDRELLLYSRYLEWLVWLALGLVGGEAEGSKGEKSRSYIPLDAEGSGTARKVHESAYITSHKAVQNARKTYRVMGGLLGYEGE